MWQELEGGCEYCSTKLATKNPGPDWSFLESVVVICLRERDDRFAEACGELHYSGLCQRKPIFYRPDRHPEGFVVGCWDSHLQVARRLAERGNKCALVLEDDFYLTRECSPEEVADRTNSMLAILPQDKWKRFMLGHMSWLHLPYRANVSRVFGLFTHAVVLSQRGIEWVLNNPPQSFPPIDSTMAIRMSHSYGPVESLVFQRVTSKSDRSAQLNSQDPLMYPENMRENTWRVWLVWAVALLALFLIFFGVLYFLCKVRWRVALIVSIPLALAPLIVGWVLILTDVV